MEIAWGKKVSQTFVDRVKWIQEELHLHPTEGCSQLMACMAFESGGTFSASVKNAAGSGACVDTETEVLTEFGWKRYDEVNVGDMIYTINYDKGEVMELNEVIHMTIKQSDNNYRMTSRSFDALSTHDHNWFLLQRYYNRTDNTPAILQFTSEEIANLKSSPTYNIPHVSIANVDTVTQSRQHPLALYRLVGLIAGDGSISKSSGRIELVASSRGSVEQVMTIYDLNDQLFGDKAPVPDNNKGGIGLFRWSYTKEQREYLLQFFDVEWNSKLEQSRFIKKLNPSIFQGMDYEAASALLDGYMMSDGHEDYKRGGRSFRNAEQALIDDFMAVATLCGNNARQVTDHRGGTYIQFPGNRKPSLQQDIHTVWLRDAKYTSCAKHQMKVEHVTEEITVWCPTVVNGNFIAKRNGTIYVTGNCGLIQFMPKTAIGLGTTVDKLAKMTAEDQLNYVYKYFRPYKGRLKNLGDIYMAILWPGAIGKPDSHVLWSQATRPTTYLQNRGLDVNKDGHITRAECLVHINSWLERGLLPENKLVL